MGLKPKRRSLRLSGFDYTQAGAYFITICLQNRLCLLGEVIGGMMNLSAAGEMVRQVWEMLPARFPTLQQDYYVVMPNHFHGIVFLINPRRGESCIRPIDGESYFRPHIGDYRDRPYGYENRPGGLPPRGTAADSVGRTVQAFKSMTTINYISGVKNHGWQPFPGRLWQRNYYEHVIRDEEALNRIREYIKTNPLRWHLDRENPLAQGQDDFDVWLNTFPRSSLSP